MFSKSDVAHRNEIKNFIFKLFTSGSTLFFQNVEGFILDFIIALSWEVRDEVEVEMIPSSTIIFLLMKMRYVQ